MLRQVRVTAIPKDMKNSVWDQPHSILQNDLVIANTFLGSFLLFLLLIPPQCSQDDLDSRFRRLGYRLF